ncbi:hypothetical protein PR048_015273 [Dryococelus australis]|uniref:HAT C-terminal dimerisation domain-containing protein n=1 Tax=Dryococelus australis TaxID=614101 RepID=A0ABQ9HGM7_9NEOP|nr:hypothetical protein PR048_015273 [Dryococelus australis]
MCATNKGFIGRMNAECEASSVPKPLTLHCILLQEALCGKSVDMSWVMNPINTEVNFVQFHELKHRHFKSFLEEVESLSPDLPYHTALRAEIEICLNEKEISMEILSDKEWLWKLAFFADVALHLNELNKKLQRKDSLICDLYTHVKSFRQKRLLFEQQISQKNFTHFICYQSLEHVQPSLQLDLIDLQANDIMKDKFKEASLVQFYNFLPEENYPKINDFAVSFLSIFGTTYPCEQTFPLLKFTKSKYRGNLSDQHLRDILLTQQTELEPQFDINLASKSKFHTSD